MNSSQSNGSQHRPSLVSSLTPSNSPEIPKSRAHDIGTLSQILSEHGSKNNPILVGNSSLAQRELVRCLAQDNDTTKSAEDQPDRLQVLHLKRLMVDTEDGGRSSLKAALQDIAENAILYVPDVHLLFGQGNKNTDSALGFLEQSLLQRVKDKTLRCIAGTTDAYYKQYQDVLQTHFEPLFMEPFTSFEVKSMLREMRDEYDHEDSILVLDCAVRMSVRLAVHYYAEEPLPEAAAGLIDETIQAVKEAIKSQHNPDIAINRRRKNSEMELATLKKINDERSKRRQEESLKGQQALGNLCSLRKKYQDILSFRREIQWTEQQISHIRDQEEKPGRNQYRDALSAERQKKEERVAELRMLQGLTEADISNEELCYDGSVENLDPIICEIVGAEHILSTMSKRTGYGSAELRKAVYPEVEERGDQNTVEKEKEKRGEAESKTRKRDKIVSLFRRNSKANVTTVEHQAASNTSQDAALRTEMARALADPRHNRTPPPDGNQDPSLYRIPTASDKSSDSTARALATTLSRTVTNRSINSVS